MTAHPESEAIRTRFNAAIAAFNENNFTEAGFPFYVSAGFLDRGRNKDMWVAEAQAERSTGRQLSPTIQSVTGSGDYAVMTVNMGDGKIETMYFRKESGLWLLYGNQKFFDPFAKSARQMYTANPYQYWVNLAVEYPTSPLATITGVNVQGPGLPTGGIQLYHDSMGRRWHCWSQGTSQPNLCPQWATEPATPLDYVFNIAYTGGTGTPAEVQTLRVSSFVSAAPPQGSLSPASGVTVTQPLTFSWGSAGAGYTYRVEVNDLNWNRIWSSDDISGTSVAYGGPPLAAGQYMYNLITVDSNYNYSMITTPFAVSAPVQTITVSGFVRDWNGNVIPSPGVTVSVVGDATKTMTSSTTDGTFSLSGIPTNTVIALKFSRSGYLDVYSSDLGGWTSDVNINADAYGGSAPFNMPTLSDLAALGIQPASGKSLITGRVSDQTFRYSSNVGGVTVTATGGGKTYPVFYRDPFGNMCGPSGNAYGFQTCTSTWGNGRYYVLNVDGADTVSVSAARTGWTFAPRTFRTNADSVSQGRVWGQSPGYDVSFAGFVKNTGGAAIAGATVALNGDPNKNVTSGGDGAFALSALPRDANFYVKTTASGYVPVYSGPINLAGAVSGLNIVMLTSTEMTNFGVTGTNGLITGIVTDQALNPLSGATVALTSRTGTTYTVNYLGGTGSTSATGKFLVPNVQPGDVVKIEVTKTGYTFPATYLDCFTGAVTGKYFVGLSTAKRGDINGDDQVNLADAILAMRVMAGLTTSGIRANYATSGADVNGDGMAGLHELLYILQFLSGLRQ